MKKTLIAITLFLTQISFSQILETKDADNNALLFVGKIGEKLQNQLKKDTVFKNGQYVDTILNSKGCDSILTIN